MTLINDLQMGITMPICKFQMRVLKIQSHSPNDILRNAACHMPPSTCLTEPLLPSGYAIRMHEPVYLIWKRILRK